MAIAFGKAAAVLAGALLASALPALPASAQYLESHLEAQRYDNLRRHQQRIAKQRRGKPQGAKRRTGAAAKAEHVRACARRYPSYDPRTDRYQVRPRITARCRL